MFNKKNRNWSNSTKSQTPVEVVESKDYDKFQLNDENGRLFLYSFMRPFLIIGTILGLFPLPKFYRKNGPSKFRYCSFLYFFSLLILLYILFIDSFCLISYLHIVGIVGREFKTLVALIFSALGKLGSSLSLVIIFIDQQKLSEVYQHILEMDDLLPSYEGNTKRVIKYCGWILLLFMLIDIGINFMYHCIVGIMTTGFGTSILEKVLTICVFLLNFLNLSIDSFTLLHATAFSLIISQLYYNINEKISNTLPPIVIIKKFFEENSELQKFSKENYVIKELEHCRYLHLKAYRFTQVVSSYFSKQLLVEITTTFLTICYKLFENSGYLKMGAEYQTFFLNSLMTSVLLARIAILSYSADVLTHQNRKLLEVLALYKSLWFRSDRLTSVLTRFSQQVDHLQPVLSVVGFFSVSRKFLISMIGTICTYVIILIQFADSEPPDESSSHPISQNASANG